MATASIIIPHHNDPDALTTCLTALSRCDDIHTADVVVVDNGIATVTADLRANFPNARFFFDPTPGAANARNRGVAEASADKIIFLDSDCVPHRHFLTGHLAALQNADFVGGEVLVTTPADKPLTGAQAFERVFAFDQRTYIRKKGFSVTANLSTHRRVFDRVGPFNPGVSEDLEWCHRAKSAGYKLIFTPSAKVDHPARQTWGDLTAKWRRLTSESYALHCSQGGSQAAWIIRACAMPFSILVHAQKILTSKHLTTPSERWAALQTLSKLRLWRTRQMLKTVSKPPEMPHLEPKTMYKFP